MHRSGAGVGGVGGVGVGDGGGAKRRFQTALLLLPGGSLIRPARISSRSKDNISAKYSQDRGRLLFANSLHPRLFNVRAHDVDATSYVIAGSTGFEHGRSMFVFFFALADLLSV